jgi:DNA-binding LytR/AlgR family response regulator
MKVDVKVNPKVEETTIEIQCREITSEIKAIERLLSFYDLPLTGKKEGRFYKLFAKDVYYIDAMDHEVFIYTKTDIYETNQKLYQLEEMYPSIFLRVNKNTLVNPKMIHSFKSSINGRMEAELINKDRLIISRMYVKKLKEVLRGELS